METRALQAWLDGALGGRAALRVTPVTGGASNLTFKLERAGKLYALRLPPPHRNDESANTVLRETRLLQALLDCDIPHARLVGHCADPGVLGAPFMLLEWVDGFTPTAPLPTAFETPAEKARLCEQMIDALAGIANAPWQRMGLLDFGKSEGFLERQVSRWRQQFARASLRDLPEVAVLSAWLSAHTPAAQRATLMHGDFTFLNVLFAHSTPPTLLAVIDWELSTIGDPLLDLGWLLCCWPEPGEPASHATYFDWRSVPSRAVLAERYARATGLDVSSLGYYMALALFKFASIMEGWYNAYRTGKSQHPTHAAMETAVPHILRRALNFTNFQGDIHA